MTTQTMTQAAGVTDYAHMLLKVADIDRSHHFYKDLLGFTPRNAKPLPDGRPFVPFLQGLALTSGGVAKSPQIDHIAFKAKDVPAIAAAAHEAGATVLMDNTWASPYLFRSFEHGVDVSIHAATKYIVGHSDVILGAVITNEKMYMQVRTMAADLGHCAAPDDAYYALRGLRTMGVRLERHEKNALAVAQWLQTRPEVSRVLYPALPEDPGHALWKRDFLGASGLFGVVLKPASKAAVYAMIDALDLFGIGSSWGGFESLILPTSPERGRTATRWAAEGPTLRLHIGLEDPQDLIEDLERGFHQLRTAMAARPSRVDA